MVHRARPEAESAQLRDRHDAVLARGELGEQCVYGRCP
jgi:hypothetical protein